MVGAGFRSVASDRIVNDVNASTPGTNSTSLLEETAS